jgi:hypothetical protein
MTTTYVLWETLYTNAGGAHPGKQAEQNWHRQTDLTFSELRYGGNSIDARFLGRVEHSSTEQLNSFLQSMRLFNMQSVTPTEAVAYCNKVEPVSEEHTIDFPNGYFELDADGVTIIDNKPVENI